MLNRDVYFATFEMVYTDIKTINVPSNYVDIIKVPLKENVYRSKVQRFERNYFTKR